MTEQEWLQTSDPSPMLAYLHGKVSDRKLRLFAVTCCRRLATLLGDIRLQRAIEVVERYADGLTTEADLAQVHAEYENADQYERETVAFYVQTAALFLTWHWPLETDRDLSIRKRPVGVVAEHAMLYAKEAVAERAAQSGGKLAGRAAGSREIAAQVTLLRDIFVNPFRPNTLDPTWLTWHDGLLVLMARRMYDSRDFMDMPVLADALEEAGCTNPDVLSHCRQQGAVHVRGCWLVDLLLNKA